MTFVKVIYKEILIEVRVDLSELCTDPDSSAEEKVETYGVYKELESALVDILKNLSVKFEIENSRIGFDEGEEFLVVDATNKLSKIVVVRVILGSLNPAIATLLVRSCTEFKVDAQYQGLSTKIKFEADMLTSTDEEMAYILEVV